MDIKLTPISLQDQKDYIRSVYKALTKLMEGKDITITISHRIALSDLAEALDGVEEIVAAAARIMSRNKDESEDSEEEPEDPADWWKS